MALMCPSSKYYGLSPLRLGRSVFQSNKWKDEKNWLQVVPGKSNECFKSYSDRDSAASLGRTYWHSTILMDCFLDTQPKHSLLQLKDTILYLPQYTWRRTNCNIIWLFQNQHLYLIVCISQVASTSPFSFLHAVSFWFSMSIILISLTIFFCSGFCFVAVTTLMYLSWSTEKLVFEQLWRLKKLLQAFLILFIFTLRIYSILYISISCVFKLNHYNSQSFLCITTA